MKSTINDYVLAFLEEHGSSSMIAKWNDEENQDSLEDMIPKTKTTKAKKTKDPNAPKKPKNAYMFFCADKREEAKKEAKDNKQVLSILGNMWAELKENVEEGDKKSKNAMEKYTKQAEKDKERYNEEMETYEPPTTESDDDDKPKGKGKAKKDPNAPKKPRTAYLIFCADKRKEAKEELGEGAAPKDILSHLGTMWTEAKKDPDEFNKYQELAEKDKERYKEEMGESEKAESEDKPKKAKATKAKSDSESDSEEDKPKKAKATKAKSDSESDSEEDKPKKAKATKAKSDSESDSEEDKPKKAKATKAKSDSESDSEEDKPKKAKATKAKSDSEEDKPKKKMNAYVLFSKENRAQVKEENPDMDSKAVTKELAQQWKDLDDDEKQEWKDKADELNDK
jgi:hypothetical protein